MYRSQVDSRYTDLGDQQQQRDVEPHQHQHENLFQRIFEHKKGSSMPSSDLHAEGAVKKMEVPKNWQESMPEVSRAHAPVGPLKLSEFQPPHEKDVKLCYWNRAYGNMKEDPDSAASLHRVLHQPPHQLSAQEKDGLRHVIGDGYYANPNPGEIVKAETRTVQGRNVLMVESKYKSNDPEQPNMRSLSMFVNSDGTGKYTEQIYFVAPEEKFRQYAPQAVQSMDSIKWRRPERSPH